jgi:hypothetical protein
MGSVSIAAGRRSRLVKRGSPGTRYIPINSFFPPEAAPNAEILVEETVEEGGSFLHVPASLLGDQSGDLRKGIGDRCGLKDFAIGFQEQNTTKKFGMQH